MVAGDFKHLSIRLPNVASACVKTSMLTVSSVFHSLLFEAKQNKDIVKLWAASLCSPFSCVCGVRISSELCDNAKLYNVKLQQVQGYKAPESSNQDWDECCKPLQLTMVQLNSLGLI